MSHQLDTLLDKLTTTKVALAKFDGEKSAAQHSLVTALAKCDAAKKENTSLEASLRLLEQCNIVSRDRIKAKVELLVTQGLRDIFDDPTIQFNINFITKRNQVEAEFDLSRVDTNPIRGEILITYGGGIADVISISLRIIIMQLMNLKGPLILDEPGKNVSAQHVGAFGKFLTEVSKQFDRQIILITHNEKLMEFATNTIEVHQKKGVSYIR